MEPVTTHTMKLAGRGITKKGSGKEMSEDEIIELECGATVVGRVQACRHSANCEMCDEYKNTKVDEEQCEDFRAVLHEGGSVRQITSKSEISKTTVKTHVKGECRCENDVSSLEWDDGMREWVER